MGQVIAQCFQEHESLWPVSEADQQGPQKVKLPPQPPVKTEIKGKGKGKEQSKGSKISAASAGKVQTVAATLLGQAICGKRNQSNRRPEGTPCPNGRLHACNSKLKANGRACGTRNHISADCRNAPANREP